MPVPLCVVADTRNSSGPFGGPSIAGGTSRDFTVPNSPCGVPANALAYSLNVAVVPPGPLGYLTVWPAGQAMPVAVTLNSVDGRNKTSAAIVQAGAGGAVSIFASNTTDVVLGINGYFIADSTRWAFYPLTPCRIADTRKSSFGSLGSPSLVGGQTRTFPILSSTCNIPVSALAYSLNLTAVPQGPLGFLTAFPTGQSQPSMATLNAPTGTTTANAAIVPAGSGGSIDVFAGNNADLVIDVNGYFAPLAAGGLSLYTVTPCRVLDTRHLPGGQPIYYEFDVNVAGGSCGLPTAQVYVLNATVAPPGPMGYLTLWPDGQSQPTVATLNAADGVTTNNLAIVGAGSGSVAGWVSSFSSNPNQLILDAFGYFAPTPWLSVSSFHTGSFTQRQKGVTYTVAVSNIGSSATSGTVTVTENLPSGLSLVSMSGSGWSCVGNTNACTRSDVLAAGASYPAITVYVNVASTASSPQVNSVIVSGGGSASATATDSTVVLLGPGFTLYVTPRFPAWVPSVWGPSPAFTIQTTGLNGFTDNITIAFGVQTIVGPQMTQAPSPVQPISANQSATFTVSAPDPGPHSNGYYWITVTGMALVFGDYVTYSDTVEISISEQPSLSLNVTRTGQTLTTATFSVSGTSINGYTGTVTPSVTPPSCAGVSTNPGPITIPMNGTSPATNFVLNTVGCPAGTYSVTASASGASATASFTIAPAPLTIVTSSLPSGQAQVNYSQTIGAIGGSPSYAWSVSAGALPPGVVLNQSSGALAGIPTSTGSYSFTVKVTDQANATVAQNLALVIARQPPPPLSLPPLTALNYYPRGHAWWNMLYDWYSQDCDTSTAQLSCAPGKTVAQVVDTDLQNLAGAGFNSIHVYLWDQDLVQQALGNDAFVTNGLVAPGFVGWDNVGGPQNSPHNQWNALTELAAKAQAHNIWLTLDFAVSRPDREMSCAKCSHTFCDLGAGCSYSSACVCPTSGYTWGTRRDVGCAYAAWVSSFIQQLAPYQKVLIWGVNYGVGPGPGDDFWQAACSNEQGAYQTIVSTLQRYPYSSPSGRALLEVGAVGFSAANGAPFPTSCSGEPLASGTASQLAPYSSNWLAGQSTASAWQSYPIAIQPPPDMYAFQLWNASSADLQAALECVSGHNYSGICPNTVQSCDALKGQCPIPSTQMFVQEFGTATSLELAPIGNSTASYGDSQTPTTTADGQKQWLTDTLCAMNAVGVQNTGYFGLYDAYSWWLANFDYSTEGLAWVGFFGLKSELPSVYNPGNDGAKPAWDVIKTPGVCQSPVKPVIAILPDGAVPAAGANPYYTVGDTAHVFYTAANTSSLSMTMPDSSLASSSFSCDFPNQPLSSTTALVGSCSYVPFNVTTAGTYSFVLNGLNTDVDGQVGTTGASTGPVSAWATVGPAPILTGVVDYNTGQQCNLTSNPSCSITVSELDVLELYGAGFNVTGGNVVQVGSQTLSAGDQYYFAEGYRGQINAQIGCFVPPGTWILSVQSPNPGSSASNTISVTVTAGQGCS